MDVSQAGDRSVLAWSLPCGGGKEIVIAADGIIRAPSDCSYLFAYCSHLSSVEPVIVKKYGKSLANQELCKKKLDTNLDTHCIKTGVQVWYEW